MLAEAIPGYLNRLAVRPGVTGLAQLNLPPDTDLISVRRKLVLDCEYIRQGRAVARRPPLLVYAATALQSARTLAAAVLRLRRSVTLPAMPQGVPSGGNGNGSDHTPATPVSILVQSVTAAAGGDRRDTVRVGEGWCHDLKQGTQPWLIATLPAVNIGTARTAAGRDYRARIEALLDKANGEVLADLWQEVCPYPVDELPEHHAIIEDLADFAEVLQPHLADMQADELCRLIQKYAARCRRRVLLRGVPATAGAAFCWAGTVSDG